MEKEISLLNHTGYSIKKLKEHDTEHGTHLLEEFLSKLANPTLETIESSIQADTVAGLGINPEKLIPVKVSDLFNSTNETVISHYYIVDADEDLANLGNNSTEMLAIHTTGCYVDMEVEDSTIIFISHTCKDTRINTDHNYLSFKWEIVYHVYGQWLDIDKLKNLPADVVRNTIITIYEMYEDYHNEYGDQIQTIFVHDGYFTVGEGTDVNAPKFKSVSFTSPRLLRISHSNQHFSNYRHNVIRAFLNNDGKLVTISASE